MPFWYALSLILLIAEAVARRRGPAFSLLLAACVIWAAVIVVTLIFLVPLNNRLARFDADLLTDEALTVHTTRDLRHRLRVAALVAAFVCLLLAIGR